MVADFLYLHGGRDKLVLWGPFYKDINPIHEAQSHNLIIFPKSLPPNTITLGVRFSTYEFRGTQTFRP